MLEHIFIYDNKIRFLILCGDRWNSDANNLFVVLVEKTYFFYFTNTQDDGVSSVDWGKKFNFLKGMDDFFNAQSSSVCFLFYYNFF